MKPSRPRIAPPVVGGQLTVTPPGQSVRAVIHGQPVHFFVANPRDSIQKIHATGAFYEAEELDIIRRWCPPGAVFCDIGSNVGNHAIYALKFLHAARVVLCEPNPEAIAILLTNIGLNGLLDRCDTTKLGFGLSDRDEGGKVIMASARNLGGGRIMDAADNTEGGITLRRGDELLADITPDFVKIDVEGMEMSVLAGLPDLIARARPIFFIEVDNINRDAFLKWVADNSYAVRARFRRYRANENFLIVPRRQRSAPPAPDQGIDPIPAPEPEAAPIAEADAPPPPDSPTKATRKPTSRAKPKA